MKKICKLLIMLWVLSVIIMCTACGSNSSSIEMAISEETQDTDMLSDNNTSDGSLESRDEVNLVGNTISNIAWGGRFARQGEWIYYYSWDGEDGQGLYQIKVDGTENKQLYSGMVSYINAVGDFIYFYDIREDCIKKINSDGEIETLEHGSGKLLVAQEYIYYQGDSGHYRTKTDGTELKLLINRGVGQPLNMVEGCLYYVDSSYFDGIGIYKKADEEDDVRLCDYNARNDTMGEFIIAEGDYIYFTESRGLYKVKTDGTNRETIIEFTGEEHESWNVEREFLIDNEYIYFKCNYNDWYRINVDGSQMEQIEWLSGEYISPEANGVNYIAIFDNYIYLCNDDGIRIMSIDGEEVLRIE